MILILKAGLKILESKHPMNIAAEDIVSYGDKMKMTKEGKLYGF